MTRKVVITYEVGLIQFWGDNAEVEPNADLAAYEKRQIERGKVKRETCVVHISTSMGPKEIEDIIKRNLENAEKEICFESAKHQRRKAMERWT